MDELSAAVYDEPSIWIPHNFYVILKCFSRHIDLAKQLNFDFYRLFLAHASNGKLSATSCKPPDKPMLIGSPTKTSNQPT